MTCLRCFMGCTPCRPSHTRWAQSGARFTLRGGGYGAGMTTTPSEPSPDPEVVPSGDPSGVPTPDPMPGEDPGTTPEVQPASDPF